MVAKSEAVMWAKLPPFSPLHTGKLLNPFDNGGRWPNPFEPSIEFGVVGTFRLSPPLDGDAPMSLRQGEEQEVTVA